MWVLRTRGGPGERREVEIDGKTPAREFGAERRNKPARLDRSLREEGQTETESDRRDRERCLTSSFFERGRKITRIGNEHMKRETKGN